MNYREKRYHYRVAVKTACKFRILALGDQPVSLNKEGLGLTVNLSVGGMLMKSTLVLPVSARPLLQLTFWLQEEAFILDGQITRIDQFLEPYHYGIAFTDIPPRTRQRLVRSLTGLQAGQLRAAAAYRPGQPKPAGRAILPRLAFGELLAPFGRSLGSAFPAWPS